MLLYAPPPLKRISELQLSIEFESHLTCVTTVTSVYSDETNIEIFDNIFEVFVEIFIEIFTPREIL